MGTNMIAQKLLNYSVKRFETHQIYVEKSPFLLIWASRAEYCNMYGRK